MKIVLTGGGSGGHLIPLIAVAEKIKLKRPETEFLFIGPGGKMEQEIMGKAGIRMKKIFTGKMRRYFSLLNFVDLFRIPLGIIQCLGILLFEMPDAVFSKGGHASLPVVFAAWLYRIPILIHESDSNPGMANSVLGKFSNRVAVSYPEAERYFPAKQMVLTGNPVREDIARGDAAKGRELFSLTESKKVIFVVGGSQGAKVINDKIVSILPELTHKYQVIHQTGAANFEEVARMAGELGIKAGRDNYHPIAFYGEEIKDILAASDLVISRAGANTISEIAANGKPALIIPLSTSANNHQRMNAYSIARSGGCIVLEESNLGRNMLLSRIDEILENDELRTKLSSNIKLFYHPDAADRIADGIIEMIK
jgi:UDP-N-acetylglucosamine--N-acetylmuramyl-(pentapeptide) pyrophosphoryl-undecaprenol N-acetylglucosamine transferase